MAIEIIQKGRQEKKERCLKRPLVDPEEHQETNASTLDVVAAVNQGVHGVDFPNFPVGAVTCMAYDPHLQTLCVGRSDGVLEFYAATKKTFCLKQRTAGQEDWHPRRMVWASGRLFVASLTHQIVEWDLVHLVPKGRPSSSYGGAVWDMAVHPNGEVLALATEDGHARLFDVEESGLTLRAALPRQTEDRLLSLSFSLTMGAARIFLGTCKGFASCWAWSSKQEVWAMNAARSPIWVVRQLDEKVVAFASSGGRIHLLNADTGIQVRELQTHNADILALALFSDGRCFASGVDNRLEQLTSSKVGSKTQWWKEGQHVSIHMNDVLSMCPVEVDSERFLLTGGNDGQLLWFRVPSTSMRPREVLQFHSPLSVSYIASAVPLLLTHRPRELEAWTLPVDWFPGQPGPRCTLRYAIKGKAHVVCSAISAGGRAVAYSTTQEFSLLAANFMKKWNETSLRPHHLHSFIQRELKLGSARLVQFGPLHADTNDSKALYIVTCSNEIVIINVQGDKEVKRLKPEGFRSSPITMLCVDPSETFVCVGSAEGTIAAFSVANGGLQSFMQLPRFTELCTSMTFMFSGPEASLLVTGLTADSKNAFFLYHLEKRCLHPLQKKQPLPSAFRKASPSSVLLGCSSHPELPHVALFYSASHAWVYSFSEEGLDAGQAYLQLQKTGEFTGNASGMLLVDGAHRPGEYITRAEWLRDGSLLVCRQNISSRVLAPALYRKQFAT
eukprot:GGOE01014045.1.p1 GENE.GGOE01014045.1~~GGOE01014045.1.p1  ORF type:complete len:727 (+),score=127.14 GGOE01014045.1:44-2224(+)